MKTIEEINAELLEDIQELEQELEDTKEKLEDAKGKVNCIECDIQELEQELKDAKDKIDDLEYDIKVLDDNICELEAKTILEVKTLEDEQRAELLYIAFNKFNLQELESKLGGNSFTL
jgi:peptidoglycan hydrolase CwlO-like protein